MKRILVNAMLAAVLALVAFGVQSGYLAELTDNVLAATAPAAPDKSCQNINSSPGSGDTLTVCGTYIGTTGATVTVKVLALYPSGRISSVSITSDAADGPNSPITSVSPSGQVNGGAPINGQTYTFDLSGKNNKVNNTYTFGEKPGCFAKSKCP
jgi:hypothetical protein